MRIGFIGTGRIAAAMVTALCEVDPRGHDILVSPRGSAMSSHLAERFDSVTVAPDNQAVVTESDIVFVAVRPGMAEDVLAPLIFRESHQVLSLMALIPLARLESLVQPALSIRALCLPSVALGGESVVLYPGASWARELLAPVCQVVIPDDEYSLEMMWSVTGLMATHLQLLSSTSEWLKGRGVPPAVANRYIRSTFAAVYREAEASDLDLDRLVVDAQTLGGINEQALAELREAGVFEAVDGVLDNVAERLLRG